MFLVLPENAAVIHAYDAVQTQWRRDASGAICGLDYPGVAIALRCRGIKIKKVFRGLQIMESETLLQLASSK